MTATRFFGALNAGVCLCAHRRLGRPDDPLRAALAAGLLGGAGLPSSRRLRQTPAAGPSCSGCGRIGRPARPAPEARRRSLSGGPTSHRPALWR